MVKNSLQCAHFNLCSGCTLDRELNSPPILAEVEAFFSSLGIDLPPVGALSPEGWRRRAKLAVRLGADASQNEKQNEKQSDFFQKNQVEIGLFQKNSHQTLSIPNCLVHHPQINVAVAKIKEWLTKEPVREQLTDAAKTTLTPYHEPSHTGDLRYLQLTVEEESGRVQAVFVINGKEVEATVKESLQALYASDPLFWHSIWLNFNAERHNVIFGREWQQIAGESFLKLSIKERPFWIHPGSFMQANWQLFNELVSDLQSVLEPTPLSLEKSSRKGLKKGNLVELYAGVGMMGLSLAHLFEKVDLVENNPFSAMSFNYTVNQGVHKVQGVELKTAVAYHPLAAAEAEAIIATAAALIVDPPRKGLDLKVVQALNEAPQAHTLIYVSCHFASFKRDCARLIAGGWKVTWAKAYLFFPGTDHLEIAAVFNR